MDRIDDAYNGLMGDEFMRKTRTRLHWMCSRVNGTRILDVGCSQGTLARLLAPLGKSVLGVDINGEAISYAEGKLAEMDAASRDRLRFVSANFMDFKTGEHFDTIVMGEILEHLPDPAAFVKKAWGHLASGGTYVITVPFGINDDPDHKQTFYFSWIKDIVAPLFDVKEIEYFGKWIGVVGIKRDRKVAVEKTVPVAVIRELEEAFYALERPLVNDNKARGLKLQTQKQTLDEVKKNLMAQAAEAKNSVNAEVAKLKDSLAKMTADKSAADAAAAKQKTVLEGEVARQKNALAAEQAKTKDLNTKLVAARNELMTVKNEALELRVTLDADRKVAAGQTEQITVLKAALQFAANHSNADANETKLLEYSHEVRDLRNALDAKSDEVVSRAETIGKLSGQIEAFKVEKEHLSSKIAELTAYVKLCETEISKLTSAREELVDAKSALSDEIGVLKEEKGSIEAALVAARAEKSGQASRISALESSLAAANEQAKVNGAKIAELSSELAKCKVALGSETSKATALMVELGNCKAVLDAKTAKADALTVELGNCKAALDEKTAKVVALKSELGNCKAALDEKTAKVVALKSELGNCKAALDEKTVKAVNLAVALEKSNATLRDLKSVMAKRDTDIAKIRTQLDAERKQKQQLERQLKAEKFAHEKLAKAKLGRLTLAYWRIKDGIKARIRSGKAKKAVPSKASEKPGGAPAAPRQSAKPADEKDEPGNGVAKALPPKGDETFYQRMAARIADMPESNGCRYFKRSNTRIAIICDQFYWDSMYSAADFVYVRPDSWKSDIIGIDCLLVVSAWHGLHNGTDWQGLPYENSKRRLLAYEVIDACKAMKIPTVFYSKEDPPSYKEFLGIAKRCDYVFTSAEECVADYRRDCGHDRVWSLSFCINPEYHNPVGMRHGRKENGVIFSGSWMTKFPERCRDLSAMFDGVLAAKREMRIIDRCYNLRDNDRYRYPDKYVATLSPAIEHKDLQKIHKLYDWAVNINTVRDSRTMFANRVFELQASGNLLLSNYSLGVSNMFPTVFIPYDMKEVGRILDGFTPEEVYERQVAGVRRVMSKETCFDRLGEMMSKVGLPYDVVKRKVMVVCDRITDRIREMFDLQTYGEKVLVASADVTDAIYRDCDIVAFFDEGISYGAFYLEDMVNAFKYTDSDYVSKAAYVEGDRVVEGPEHEYIGSISEKNRTLFWRESFSWPELREMKSGARHGNGYAVDHFNCTKNPICVVNRPRADVSVIIPIHNNGWFLYGRSFAGLRRSSLFDRMEILLVDDGSTDGFTPKMIRYLESRYPNVRSFFFEDGGSGTPSRPRNMGVEIASTSNIIFCDPDNEPVCDGYAELFKVMESETPALDVVLGNSVMCTGQYMTFDYYSVIKHNNDNNVVVTDGRKVLSATAFLAANIQTMVIRRSFIQKNNLTQVVGGIGEDSQFSNEMMLACDRLKVVPVKVQVYYAERGNSIVNAVKENFFIKHSRTEEVRVSWLNQNNLMANYMAKRFAEYVTLWYFNKLKAALPQDGSACARRLYGILALYKGHYNGGNQAIDTFMALCEKSDFTAAYLSVLSS